MPTTKQMYSCVLSMLPLALKMAQIFSPGETHLVRSIPGVCHLHDFLFIKAQNDKVVMKMREFWFGGTWKVSPLHSKNVNSALPGYSAYKTRSGIKSQTIKWQTRQQIQCTTKSIHPSRLPPHVFTSTYPRTSHLVGSRWPPLIQYRLKCIHSTAGIDQHVYCTDSFQAGKQRLGNLLLRSACNGMKVTLPELAVKSFTQLTKTATKENWGNFGNSTSLTAVRVYFGTELTDALRPE